MFCPGSKLAVVGNQVEKDCLFLVVRYEGVQTPHSLAPLHESKFPVSKVVFITKA